MNDGGQVFPTAMTEGMSLRDWFAGQALAGWVMTHVHENATPVPHMCAELAYEIADAMIAARAGPGREGAK